MNTQNLDELRDHWLSLVYAGDLRGGGYGAQPEMAARLLAEKPDIAADDAYIACAVGDEAAVLAAIEKDREWVNRPGGALKLPPLVAVTHSSLSRLQAFRERLRACARLLLDAGADPNQSVVTHAGTERLTAIYGAVGQNHDAVLTKMLLEAGADPNDNESLYHCLPDRECLRVLLEHGTRVAGTNATARALDFDDPELLAMLLKHGADPNEDLKAVSSRLLLHAIRRSRSAEHFRLLLEAGADPNTLHPHGVSLYRLASMYGLSDAAALLKHFGATDTLSEEDEFIAACARGDDAEARRIQAKRPDLPSRLPEGALALLPMMAANANRPAVETMVKLGWPIEARGADIGGSALNCAVFRGDVAMTRFLLEHGASWTGRHNFNSNVVGTLSWASCNRPAAHGDWLGCAQALVEYGMPRAQRPPGSDAHELPHTVIIDGHEQMYPPAITEFLLQP